MANVCYSNAESNNGTTTVSAPAGPGTTWNLTSIQVSQSGPTVGPNAKVTVWDGAVGTGTKLYSAYLSAPGAGYGGSLALGSSVGVTQDLPLPKAPNGVAGIQGTPGNAMNVQVTGTGQNNVSLNCRFSDGLP